MGEQAVRGGAGGGVRPQGEGEEVGGGRMRVGESLRQLRADDRLPVWEPSGGAAPRKGPGQVQRGRDCEAALSVRADLDAAAILGTA